MSDDDNELGNNLFDPQAAAAPKARRTKKAEGRTWIKLEESADIPPTGLPIGINGDVVMIMAGEPVHLKNEYVEILDNAIVSVPQRDAQERVVGYRERHRFPYTKVDAPPSPE